MCDVCKSLGQDYKFINGKKDKLQKASLYQVLVGKTATIKLCYIHDIELFHLGERRFMTNHVELAPMIRQQM